MAAAQKDNVSTADYALAKQWLASKGIDPMEMERNMQGLRDCVKLLREDKQALVPPGAKFGRLCGNRALNNKNFVQ